jgi:hypothetical protein
MSNFNFNSQVCTTKEQSECLIQLGLKKETADMCYSNAGIPAFHNGEYTLYAKSYASVMIGLNNQLSPFDYIPAWSLHRLMTLCPEKLVDGRERVIKDMYTPDEYELWVSLDQCSYLDVTARYGGETLGFFYEDGNLYDALIACIEWLIKNGNFNKEYLEE